jgi:hypothetical protein
VLPVRWALGNEGAHAFLLVHLSTWRQMRSGAKARAREKGGRHGTVANRAWNILLSKRTPSCVAGEEREETEKMAYREREFVGSVHSLFGHSNGRLREGRDLLSHLKGDFEELWRRMR